jgi:hypothetical protein
MLRLPLHELSRLTVPAAATSPWVVACDLLQCSDCLNSPTCIHLPECLHVVSRPLPDVHPTVLKAPCSATMPHSTDMPSLHCADAGLGPDAVCLTAVLQCSPCFGHDASSRCARTCRRCYRAVRGGFEVADDSASSAPQQCRLA